MTKVRIEQDKNLLYQDICARLPYHPILNWKFVDGTSKDEELKELSDLYIWWIIKAQDCEVKPYLRSMSSMTEEEMVEYKHLVAFSGNPIGSADFIDWLNASHFDYRGLIEKGLAIDCTSLNIY